MQEYTRDIYIYRYIWNIEGIFKDIHKYLCYKIIRNKEHRGATFGGAPDGAAAKAAPVGLCSVVLIIKLSYIMNN